MSNYTNNYSSRHDNLCKSIRITVLSVSGIETQEPQQYCVRVNFPREELEYMSPRIKSCGPIQFKYITRFVPDEILRNDLSLIFYDPLRITLFTFVDGKRKCITVFPIDLTPLITRKQIKISKKTISNSLQCALTINVELKWESSFDRNARRKANLRIFNYSDFESVQTISQTPTETYQIVKQKKSDKIYAMKILTHNDRLAALSQGADHESDALVTFNHPSILHIVGFIPRRFINRQQSAIVMDYIPNGTLLSAIESKNPPPDWSATTKSKIIYGIAFGLQLLHTNGLMHNDLTPNSILLDENYEPLIGEIGLARTETSNLEVKDLVYKAPEILLDKPYDTSADVYSFGMIVYHLVTGSMPYAGYTAPELMKAIIHGIKPSLPFDTSRNLVQLIDMCISYDPLQRPKLEDLVKTVYPSNGRNNRKSEIDTSIQNNGSNLFVFPGTVYDEFFDFCDRMNGRVHFTTKSAKSFDYTSDKTKGPKKMTSMERIILAAKSGNAYSQFIYALLTKKDKIEADYFKLAADSGITEAQYDFGVMLADGIVVAKDMRQAAIYFKSAADKGNAKAQLNIGMLHAEGKFIPKNDREAIRYFMESARQGNVKAQLNLGLMWMNGRGVRRSESEAIKYYKMAADQGDPQAMYNLAIMMWKGRGNVRNEAMAVRYFKKAADAGLVKAMFSMGLALLEGRGVPKNEGKASHYFKVAADSGMPPAQLNMSILLSKGQGVARNELDSLKYIKEAADNGEPEAQSLIGMMLLSGKGVVKHDVALAAKYLGDAAANGSTKAMVNIGMMFLKGLGVQKSDAIAAKCFKVAASKGNEKAKRNLEMMINAGRIKG